MINPVSLLIRAIITVTVFLGLKIVISYVALSSFSLLLIEAEFDHDDHIAVYFTSTVKNAGFRETLKKKSEPFINNTKSTERVFLNNHVARKIRIDTGHIPGSVKLFSLRLTSNFGPDIVFDHQDIYKEFSPNNNITSFTLNKDHVLIRTNSTDPYITLKSELVTNNVFLEVFLPLVFALIVLIGSFFIKVRALPAFSDINSRRSSTGANVGALDGIRGLAALLVLGQHTAMTGTGGIFGVWLFFCLSGFLLATPFVKQPNRALSWPYMTNYLIRRIKRIVPMYYVMITVTILFMGKIDVAIRHYLFLQADGHYWTITQEMFF